MAQTTSSTNACDVQVYVDNAGGSLTEISGSSNNASIDMTVQTAETFTFEGQWSIRKACKTSATVSIQVLYSMTADEGLDIMRDWFFSSPGTARSLQVDIPDSTNNSDRYSGEFVLESFNIPITADDAGVILCSASLLNSGEFSHSIIVS